MSVVYLTVAVIIMIAAYIKMDAVPSSFRVIFSIFFGVIWPALLVLVSSLFVLIIGCIALYIVVEWFYQLYYSYK